MTGRYAIRLICVFLLLFAQQAAYTHAAWHAGEQTHHQSKSDATFQDELCGMHGAFSQVLGALQGAPVPSIERPAPVRIAERHFAARPGAPLRLPPARGPPIAP